MRTQARGARPSIRVSAFPRWVGFSEKCQSGSDRCKTIAEGANIRRQSRGAFCQRVEPPSYYYGVPRDNAFHLTKHRIEEPPQGPLTLLTGAYAELAAALVLPLVWQLA